MSSFLPKSGKIVSIAVYPSEFGLKRMEEEAVKGPVGLFDDGKGKSDDDDDDDDHEIDEEKLRTYEKSRLRYMWLWSVIRAIRQITCTKIVMVLNSKKHLMCWICGLYLILWNLSIPPGTSPQSIATLNLRGTKMSHNVLRP